MIKKSTAVVKVDMPTAAQLLTNGLCLSENMDEKTWLKAGQALSGLAESVAWWWADWAAHGQVNYGDLEAITLNNGWRGPSYKTLRNYAVVARRYPNLSHRWDKLTFSHHASAVSLEGDQRELLFQKAVEEKWSKRDLEDAVAAASGKRTKKKGQLPPEPNRDDTPPPPTSTEPEFSEPTVDAVTEKPPAYLTEEELALLASARTEIKKHLSKINGLLSSHEEVAEWLADDAELHQATKKWPYLQTFLASWEGQ